MPDLLVDPEGSGTEPTATPDPPEPTPPQDDLPERFKGMSPAQIAQSAEDDRTRREDAEATARRTNEAYLAAALGAQQQPAAQAEPTAPQLPDAEDDPEGHQKALIQAQIAQGVQEAVAPLQDRFLQAEAQTYTQATQTSKDRMHADPVSYPNAHELEKEIDQYLAQFPAQMQALPNARAEAYDRIHGMKRREAAQAEHLRSSTALETGAGRSSASRSDDDLPPDIPKLSDRERFSARREGLSDGMFREMQGAGVMDIDEYTALKAKEAKGRAG